jgi:hypothetical protein
LSDFTIFDLGFSVFTISPSGVSRLAGRPIPVLA